MFVAVAVAALACLAIPPMTFWLFPAKPEPIANWRPLMRLIEESIHDPQPEGNLTLVIGGGQDDHEGYEQTPVPNALAPPGK
jgi:hypothetical protein